MWEVEYTDEFGAWWDTCNQGEQEYIESVVKLLQIEGPNLEFSYSSGINGSKFRHMRELRIQHKGEPYRILMIGGCKTGNDRWYVENIKIADALYETYVYEISEVNIDD